MLKPEQYLYRAGNKEKNLPNGYWSVHVHTDKNGGKGNLVWFNVWVDSGRGYRDYLYYSGYMTHTPENEQAMLKIARELSIAVAKMFGQLRPRKMKPAVSKIVQRHWLYKEPFNVYGN